MKKLFYILIGLVLIPVALNAQGTLSLKQIYDNLTTNYYTKTASDGKYATSADVSGKADKTYVDANFATTAENALKQNISDMVDYYTKTAADLLLSDKADTDSVYTKTAADILLGLKADLTYVNATDEAILLDNDSQDVQIESDRMAITLKASQIDMDSAESAINSLNIDMDSAEAKINAHLINTIGAHAATAISATWTNVQVSLDSIEAAIQGIVIGSGFATETWVNSTLETNFYTAAQTNATIEAAIAAIPAGGGTAVEDEGTYIGSNTTWEFDADYDTTAVCIYRNRIYQPRSLFTTVDVSSKTRVVFTSAINASDEIILISNK